MLKVYILTQIDLCKEGEMQAIAVIAANKWQARTMANDVHKEEGPIWIDKALTICEEIPCTTPTILLID